MLPGIPTTAEIYIVPERTSRQRAVDEKWAHLDQVQPCQSLIFNILWQMFSAMWFSAIIKSAQMYSEEVKRLSRENSPGEYVLYFVMQYY